MSRFRDRLASLGFTTYGDYLDSQHWKAFKAKYRASGLPRVCAACGAGPVQLHHHTYQRLGCEELGDVTPLCRPCHVAVHEWLNLNKNGNVGATRKAVKALRKSPATVVTPKPAPRLEPLARTKKRKLSRKQKREARRRKDAAKIAAAVRAQREAEAAARVAAVQAEKELIAVFRSFEPSKTPLAVTAMASPDDSNLTRSRLAMRERLNALRSAKGRQ